VFELEKMKRIVLLCCLACVAGCGLDPCVQAPSVAAKGSEMASWGASLTAGNQDGTGVTYPGVLAKITGMTVYNGGISGQTSTQIAKRMLADTARHCEITITWAGRNNFTHQDQILMDHASMISALTCPRRFVVLSILNGTGEPKGTAAYAQILADNKALQAAYPDNFLDIRAVLVAHYDPARKQDVADHDADLPPASLRADSLHMNAAGYTLVAQTVADKLRAQGYIQ
jgi:lysophospholipase L1-like esterase